MMQNGTRSRAGLSLMSSLFYSVGAKEKTRSDWMNLVRERERTNPTEP